MAISHVSKPTAYKYVHRLEKGESLERKPRTNNPSKLTPSVVRSIRQTVAKNPHYNTSQIMARVKANQSVEIGHTSVRKVLHGAGFHYGRPSRPCLTPANRKERLEYAKSRLEADWDSMWSYDEIHCNLQLGSRFCWFNEKVYDTVAQPRLTNKQESVSVVAALAISRTSKSRIHYLPRNFGPQDLVDVFATRLLPEIQHDPDQGCEGLIIDNDGQHRSRAVKELLLKAGLLGNGFLPGRSPDLNPIENVNGLIKSHIRKVMPTTEEGLKAALEEAWESISSQTLKNIFDSMPGRMQLVVEAEGGKIALVEEYWLFLL